MIICRHDLLIILKMKMFGAKKVKRTFYGQYTFLPWGYAVTQFVDTLAYKVTGLIPSGVVSFFTDVILLAALWP
jgi:hypothetical protein